MSERRREPRIDIKGEVTVRIQSASDVPDMEGQIYPSRINDVSFGGLQLHLDSDIPIGTELSLEIIFNHSPEKFWHIGKVMWKLEVTDDSTGQKPYYKIGIMFEEFDNPQHDAWISEVVNFLARAK